MTPSQAISMLDRQLAAHGRALTLVRPEGGLDDLTCRGFTRNFKPDELVGSIEQSDRLAILSPTSLSPAGWLVVEEGDQVGIGEQWFRVQAADVVLIDDVPVRVELHLRGM